MTHPIGDALRAQAAAPCAPLRFTPAEWRQVPGEATFLYRPDNRFVPPRRLMGLPVEIVPDHDDFG